MHDFNMLELRARQLIGLGRPRDAMAIYLFMADGDPSLDAGYLGMRIGLCCEMLGDPHSAKWWYGRAVEENPDIARYGDARTRLESVTIDGILDQNWVKTVEQAPVSGGCESSLVGLLNLIGQFLGIGTAQDAYWNLQGAIIDIERAGGVVDAASHTTLLRVATQLLQVSDLLKR